ncbi:hypothetical protein FSW04_01535 [Baekduia soli]|uniref:Enoyl-CoA hydratase/isomerase family protein n=1 Tax=Baekduia soli TaxID=496014 RepID=A0A5B8U087_9ACTN|nr:enoyl-CoA hydratase-related protein [Baekduia soli]QEC46388.1 hypothetical protein FSW04_01535 [Baekduia soli]
MTYTTIEVTQPSPGIDLVTLNRPEALNAISIAMREELIGYLRSLHDAPTRVVILTGAGRAFCAGADVNEFATIFGPTADEAGDTQRRYQEIVRLILSLDQPVITAVNGIAAGGGTAVAMMSDLRIASESATFGVGQVKRGVIPDVGLTYLLPRLVGLGKALELQMLYERLTAREALDLGMVNWVVPDGELVDRAVEIGARLVAGPRVSLKWIKKVTYANLDRSLADALEWESAAQGICADTDDFRESCRSWAERREPVFGGTAPA